MNPDTVSAADLNNDGLPDLIVGVGNNGTPLQIEIFLADKSGNYSLASKISLPSGVSLLCKPTDLNGDKKIDLVCPGLTMPSGNGIVLAYLGNGDGTFQAPISTAVGPLNQSSTITAAADMNGDGHIDLVVALGSTSFNYIYMLLGDGAGHFTVSKFLGDAATGNATITDVNNDGIPDILTAGGSVFIGKGDGTFSTSFQYHFASCIYADFEKTSKLSAACPSSVNTLNFFHINPDGSFNLTNPLGSVSFAGSFQFTGVLQALDLNGDGTLDIVLNSNDGLQVAIGKPGLTFSVPVPYAAGTTTATNYVTGVFSDLDGDGHPDFVSTGPHSVYISYGSSSGAFSAPVLNTVGTNLYTSTTADFNGDGLPDVLTIGIPGINFLQGKGDGTFAAPVPVSLPSGYSLTSSSYANSVLLTGDFNGDGKKDFLVPVGVFSNNLLFFGNGDGSFAPGATVSAQTLPSTVGSTGGSVVADVNGDRKDDIVQVQKNSINAYLSQGDGTFRLVPSSLPNSNNYNTAIAFTDLNGDGILDALVSFAGSAIVLTGKGDGSFITTNTTLTVPTIPGITLQTNVFPVLAVGDFDGDGKPDVALMGQYVSAGTIYTTQYASAVWVYYGNGDGTFSQPVSAGQFLDNNYFHLAAGVLTESGRSDLIVAGDTFFTPVASPLTVVTSLAGHSFRAPVYFVGGEPIDSIHLADFNHDGKLDLMLSNGADMVGNASNANSFAVLLNQGSFAKGTLTTSPQTSFGGNSYTVTLTLTSPTSQTSPLGGNVNFKLDGVSIASVLMANNIATQTISTNLTAANHTLSASWAGDSTYWPLTVNAVHAITDFTLTSDSAVTIQTEHHSPIAIHLASLNGFADNLTLSCENLPAYATCTFANGTTPLAANQKIDSQVVIDTDSVLGYQSHLDGPFGRSYGSVLALLMPGCILLLVRRRIRPGILALIVGCVILTSAGCGGGGSKSGNGGTGGSTGNPPVVPPHTSPGIYTVNVVARGANSQVMHTAVVTLTVTP